ncbi:sensor protein ZraS [archaeon BMS3Bbin15]|nr:sensor protein ZraS [archaeon BMS3Bbin15]
MRFIKKLSIGTKVILMVGVVMLVLIISLFSLLYNENRESTYLQLKEQAQSIADQVVLFRLWNAQNKERIEPVLSVLSNKKFKYKWKMVSTKPIGSENLPQDEFQLHAIQGFENNPSDIYRIYKSNKKDFFEYAGPIIMEKPCLRCHIDQGYRKGDIHGAIIVTIPMNEVEKNLQITKSYLAASAIILLTSIMVLLYFIIQNTVIRHLHTLMKAFRKVGKGDYNTTLEVDRGDEIGELSRSFNRMVTELRSKEKQLIQSEKLATVGKLAAGVAHEINNPLANISLYAQMLYRKIRDPDTRKKLKIIEEQADQTATIVKSLLEFSRQAEPKFELVDFNDIVNKTLNILEPQIYLNKINVKLKLDKNLPKIYADPIQIQQVLVNIVTNAVQAMEGKDDAHLEIITRSKGDKVMIVVRDNGVGILEENLDKIFDPFFSTKGVGKGTGLGLSVSYGIIENHGGEIKVKSKPGHGSIFIIILPEGEENGENTYS